MTGVNYLQSVWDRRLRNANQRARMLITDPLLTRDAETQRILNTADDSETGRVGGEAQPGVADDWQIMGTPGFLGIYRGTLTSLSRRSEKKE